ncbi:uncharacterized protein LOC121431251 [Lytechinus variegatus]|uniref:uncharacterized protein LOC121431251 n=1 Tax=Lytechinus variegatus TaxID=7654 RepID=UPI001BB154BF|nr:uncharacterized protein LOC121431251 [Lytechinus variegatus]
MLMHATQIRSSEPRGLLSRVNRSNNTKLRVEADDEDGFTGPWYIVFGGHQLMNITVQDIVNGSTTINVTSRDFQIRQRIDVMYMSGSSGDSVASECRSEDADNDKMYTCNHTAINFDAILVSVCNIGPFCRRFLCDTDKKNVRIERMKNERPRVRCRSRPTNPTQLTNQILITIDVHEDGDYVHNITLHILELIDLSTLLTTKSVVTSSMALSSDPATASSTTEEIRAESTTLASTPGPDPGTNGETSSSAVRTSQMLVSDVTTTTSSMTEDMLVDMTTLSSAMITTEQDLGTNRRISSTNPISSIIPAVVVVFLLIVAIGVICYKRRQKVSKPAIQDYQRDSMTVLNPGFTSTGVDQNDYIECLNPVEGATMPVSSGESQQSHEYSDLPATVQPSKEGDDFIYNEVGEQDYNVLFGGKEHGDYHEYNLPENARNTKSGTYQDLLKQEISDNTSSHQHVQGSEWRGVGLTLGGDKEKALKHQRGETETDKRYENLRDGDSDYTSLLREGSPGSPASPKIPLNAGSELPSSVTDQRSEDIYNEVGEEDYNTLFGGKEQGDYHDYTLPGCPQKIPSAQKMQNAPYQDLLIHGKQENIFKPKHLDSQDQNERMVQAETDNEGYQDLRKGDNNYTSLHLNSDTPSKPDESQVNESLSRMDTNYQGLRKSDPEYACLEPNVDNEYPIDPKTGSLSNPEYQTLEPSSDCTFDDSDDIIPDYAVLEQTDIEAVTDCSPNNDIANGQEHTYESLKRDQRNPGAEKGVISDYEDPVQVIPEEPYDNLQRKELSKSFYPHAMEEKDGDGYEDPRLAVEDSANAYQSLDSLGSPEHDQTNEESDYSHLQRNPRETTSKDLIHVLDSNNHYGKLNFEAKE